MSDVLSEAQKLYAESLDAMRDQRDQVQEDLEFSDPSDPRQWDETLKASREGDPGGKRPCLVMDQTGQYVANVAGQVEKQPPSIHAIPITGGADKLAAEQIDGRFRHIEYASKASQHYQRVLTSAARTGVGYLVVRPAYIDRALGWQEPRISSEPDPMKVVFDPWSVDTDGCDATSGFILTATNEAYFESRWPGKDPVSFGDTENYRKDDTRKSVLVAEQWLKSEANSKKVIYLDDDGEEQTTDEDDFKLQTQMSGVSVPNLRTYTSKTTAIKWRRMSGEDILEESDYPADYIGIVPVYGYVSFTDGRMRYCGISRRARNPQQAYNYHTSEMMMPGAQLLASKRALAGVETLWDKVQVQRRAFLPYNDMDDDGEIQQPGLIKVGSDLVNHEAGAQAALKDIQASIGMYQANLGSPSNETSGVAIENRKQQGEASTAHFPSHMAASLGQVGQIVMQMDARLTDTKRKQPILGVDGSAGSVMVDPGQKKAFSRGSDNGVTINPKVGSYGVRVVVGASYSTQRSQTNEAFGEIMRGNPELAPTVAPFWAQTLDFPGSDKFAQAMAAMAPPPVKAIIQPEGADKGPTPAMLAAQLQQCQQALQEAIQHAREAQGEADQAGAAAAQAKQLGDVRERELNIEAYNAETNRLKVTGANADQIQAIVQQLLGSMAGQPTPMPALANETPAPLGGPVPSGGPGIGVNVAPTSLNPSGIGESPAMPQGIPSGVPQGPPQGQIPGVA